MRFLLVLLFVLNACAGSGKNNPTSDTTSADTTGADTTGTDATGADASGKIEVKVGLNGHRIMVDGIEREVLVYAPESALKREAAPMVLFFHGSNQTGKLAFENFGWREVADREGLIVVYPTALNYCFRVDDNWDGKIDSEDPIEIKEKWANGDLQDPTKLVLCTPEELASLDEKTRAKVDHPRMEDRTFVDEILKLIPSNYPVDPKRMYLSGFSGGGSFATRMTQELSDVFVATQVCAGGLGVPPVETSRGISYALILGTEDDGQAKKLGLTAFPFLSTFFEEYPEAIGILDPILTMLGLSASPDDWNNPVSLELGSVSAYLWEITTSPKNRGNTFRFMLVNGMGHEYPTHPLPAAELAWEFFEPQSLP